MRTSFTLYRWTARLTRLLLLPAVALIQLAAADEAQAVAYMHRPEITARAEAALNTYYTWGRESWIPNTSGTTGPDCSGFVLKCWQVPRTMLYQEENGEDGTSIQPRYTTYHFAYDLGPWYSLSSRSQLEQGDALVYRTSSGGHIVLYAEGDPWGYPVIYEAPYTGATVRRVSRYLDGRYVPKRRMYLSGNAILLDNPTAKSTAGDDVGGNWRRSTSVDHYWGSDYQCRYGTSVRSYARWTPRIPRTGYYEVYLRWTSWWNRASNAKVTINTATGQRVRYVDQRVNGGRWVSLGRHYFEEGYFTGRGSVSVHATGANGWVIADAALFVPR